MAISTFRKTYQGAIKVIGGKPVFEYDEVVTG